MSTATDTRPAVFVDKDDTIIRDVPYNTCPALIEWLPGALPGLRRLAHAGFELVVVTNQSGVSHGISSEDQLTRYLAALADEAAGAGVRLAALEYCPHHPEAKLRSYRRFCACRKPNPGMLVRAARRLGLDPARSWMVGDLLDDIEAGTRAGCRTALVAVHADQVPPPDGVRHPDVVAPSFEEAAARILAVSRAVA